jgi:hypothetical protein
MSKARKSKSRAPKYRIEFKMKSELSSRQPVNLVCNCRDMEDVRRKLRIFKAVSMPWSYDFKLYQGSDGPFIRDL